MQAETSKKQYESRHRLTWASSFPLKPGRDAMSRRGLLVLIADTAISGSFYQSQQKLAERAGVSVRGVRKALAKLCDERALWAHTRSYGKTTRYTLLRLAEVAEHGSFLPAGAAAPPFERNSSTSQTAAPPPFERNSSSPQSAFERNSSSSKEHTTKKEERTPPTPPLLIPQPKAGTMTPTAQSLDEHFVQKTGRPLPGAWVRYPELQQQLDRQDFLEVRSVLEELLNQTGGHLPDPGKFFKNYEHYAPKPMNTKRHRRRRRAA